VDIFPAGAGIFSRRHRVKTGSVVHPASCPMSTGVKNPRREADHSPPSGAEVKNVWSAVSTHSIRFNGVMLI